jgi:innexin
MFALLKPLKLFVTSDPVTTCSWTSRLHQFTAAVLLLFSLVLASCQFLGKPMNCMVVGFEMPKDYVDDFCFVQTTFIDRSLMDPKLVGKETLYPGVGARETQPQNRKDIGYYQWVCYVLCFQGLCFYLPLYLWSLWEGGKMKMLAMDLTSPVVAEDKKNERKKLLVDYFTQNLHRNKCYALGFYLCELLSLVNVVGQICLTDWFLGGQLFTFGLAVLGIRNPEEMEDASDAMALVFPKNAKCIYHSYGPSGSIQRYDAFCLLNHNIVNEKIYIFIFGLFCSVAMVSFLVFVLYWTTLLCIRPLRTLQLKGQTPLTATRDVETVSQRFHVDDWFVLRMLGRNINPVAFHEIVTDLAAKLNKVDGAEV